MSGQAAVNQRVELAKFSLSAMVQLGRELSTVHHASQSMEEVADRIVQAFRERFIDERGELTNVLVRFYKTMFFADLDDRLREIATASLRGARAEPGMRCLTLLASAGEKPQWNMISHSQNHQCIPLPSSEGVAGMPMIAQLMQQLGVQLSTFDAGSTGMLMDLDQHQLHNVFYVPEALGNPCIPDQTGFVIPHGIRSVVGFGGSLPGHQMFAVIAFTRSHISRDIAALFGPLSLCTKLAVMQFHRPDETFRENRRSTVPSGTNDAEFLALKIQCLEQLVHVYEGTVADQARLMERAHAELYRQALVDPLTNLANRRAFDHRLTLEWTRSQRSGHPLALLLIDVDLFKQYNDCLGHLAGDDCLRLITQVLVHSVRRSTDLVADLAVRSSPCFCPIPRSRVRQISLKSCVRQCSSACCLIPGQALPTL